MSLPTSGPLSLGEIRDEFEGSDPVLLSDYYRGGGRVTTAPVNSNVPTSGTISVEDFYGANNEVYVEVTSTQVNLDIATLFPAPVWSNPKVDKRVQINNGVTIGSNTTAQAALQVPSNYQGTVFLDNNGSIQGAGGNGGVGGNAVNVSSGNPTAVEINNQGTIYRGGGAGGNGGVGGNSSCPPTTSPGPCNPGNGGCGFTPGCGSCNPCGSNCVAQCAPGVCFFVARCSCPQSNPQPPSSGGGGGLGGRGQGYDGAAQPGTSGSNSNRCGTGGRGGNGGDGGAFGAAGDNGNNGNNGNQTSGGSGGAGFAAGNYINGVSGVNWVNLGTVAGNAA